MFHRHAKHVFIIFSENRRGLQQYIYFVISNQFRADVPLSVIASEKTLE